MGIEITSESFRREVTESGKPVLVDFWATWCPPCREFSAAIDQVADGMKVCRVNVDDEPELAAAFHVSTVPSAALVKEGKIIGMTAGASRAELEQMINGRFL